MCHTARLTKILQVSRQECRKSNCTRPRAVFSKSTQIKISASVIDAIGNLSVMVKGKSNGGAPQQEKIKLIRVRSKERDINFPNCSNKGGSTRGQYRERKKESERGSNSKRDFRGRGGSGIAPEYVETR